MSKKDDEPIALGFSVQVTVPSSWVVALAPAIQIVATAVAVYLANWLRLGLPL